MVMTINEQSEVDKFLYTKTPKLLDRIKLSDHEKRIYKMRKKGMSATQIGKKLNIMAQTVHSSLSHIKNKGWR